MFGCVIQPAIPNLVIEYHIVHYRHYIHETQCLNLVWICLDDLDHKLLGFRVYGLGFRVDVEDVLTHSGNLSKFFGNCILLSESSENC